MNPIETRHTQAWVPCATHALWTGWWVLYAFVFKILTSVQCSSDRITTGLNTHYIPNIPDRKSRMQRQNFNSIFCVLCVIATVNCSLFMNPFQSFQRRQISVNSADIYEGLFSPENNIIVIIQNFYVWVVSSIGFLLLIPFYQVQFKTCRLSLKNVPIFKRVPTKWGQYFGRRVDCIQLRWDV